MLSDRFLRNRRFTALTPDERDRIESSISEVRELRARTLVVRAEDVLDHSTLLVDGFMCRYIDDERGLRQLVAIHVPGDFVDLHAYPLKSLDHNIATLTPTSTALVPHSALKAINDEMPDLTRKLWFATVLDAAIHRAWLFRLGRLDAVGRVAHFLSETNARLAAVGLSDGRRFSFGITQNDLAEICGLTSVHVNRVMRQLREDRLCTFRSGLVRSTARRRWLGAASSTRATSTSQGMANVEWAVQSSSWTTERALSLRNVNRFRSVRRA